MKKIFYIILLLASSLHFGCGNSTSQVPHTDIDNKDAESNLDLNLDLNDDASLKMLEFKLSLMSDGIMSAGSLDLTLSCDDVFGTGASGDWTQTVSIATTGATPDTASVSIISGKACTISMNSYVSGANTWLPSSTALPIAISTAGNVSASGSVYEYTNSLVNQYFTAYPNGTNAALIYYSTDPTNTPITLTNLSPQAVALTIHNVPAPTVSFIGLFKIPALNGAAISYTFIATASPSIIPVGSLSCKYILASSFIGTITTWTDVNSIFNGVTATACPNYTPLSPASLGNWTSNYGPDYYVIFANTVDNLTSYVTYTVP